MKNKYFNKKVIYDNYSFDSKKERDRYIVLKAWARNNLITNFLVKPKFPFDINGKPIKANDKRSRQICYIADFSYVENGKIIVEDVKSSFTKRDKVFRLKKALFDTIYGARGLTLRVFE